MLIHLQVTARTDAEHRVGGTVLQTGFLTELATVGGSTVFSYLFLPESRRGGKSRITVSDTVARIRAIMNQDNAQSSITLAVYPEEDITADTVWTTFNIDEIIQCYPYSRANRQTVLLSGINADSMSYLWVNEKGQAKRYIINHYYMEVVQLNRTVSTSTTTS